MVRHKIFLWLWVGMLFFSTTACSVRRMMVQEMVDALETGLPAYEQESDVKLLEQAFPAHIKLLETLLVNQPENDRLMVLLARMYAGYAFSIFEEKLDALSFSPKGVTNDSAVFDPLKKAISRYYLKGAGYALSAIEKRHPGSREKLSKIPKIQSVMDILEEQDVPALFWYGFNLGGHLNRNQDSILAVSKAHLVDKVMNRIIDLDPGYYHGSAHLFLMISYASRPPMMGGSTDKARNHYVQLKALSEKDFLLGDVLYARYILHRLQKKKEFKTVLENIISRAHQPKDLPLLDTLAVRRAQIYLDGINRLFP
jgi:hypothetical protein